MDATAVGDFFARPGPGWRVAWRHDKPGEDVLMLIDPPATVQVDAHDGGRFGLLVDANGIHAQHG